MNTSVTKTNLSLTDGTTYYFYVKATNRTGVLTSEGVSDGITVSLAHDLGSEFSLSDNPNGDWTYGTTPNLDSGYTLTPYDQATTDTNGIQRWHMQAGAEPSVTHNPDANPVSDTDTTWPAYATALSPGAGADSDMSVVRWTAPANGTYNLYAKFWDITGGYTSTDIHILKNGTPVTGLEGNITNAHDGTSGVDQPVQTFSTTITVSKNDYIDFAVGCGDDGNGDRDTTGLEVRLSPAVASSGEPQAGQGLPTANLNNDAGADRCNIRWANDTYDDTHGYTKSYGDTFTLGAGSWVIDTIRVWAVPEIPMAPAYFLGSHFSSVTLYGGTTTGGLSQKSSGGFVTARNQTDNKDIFIKPVSYNGTTNYQTAAGDFNQIWQVDFNNLNWSVTDGTQPCVFAVQGTPRVDRLWFNHATRTGDPYGFWLFDVISSTLTETHTASWFDGHDSSINVQVFAHRI